MTSRNASILVDPFQPARPFVGAAHMERDERTHLVEAIEHEVTPGMPVLLEISVRLGAGMMAWVGSAHQFGAKEVDLTLDLAQQYLDRYNARAEAALKRQQQQAAGAGSAGRKGS